MASMKQKLRADLECVRKSTKCLSTCTVIFKASRDHIFLLILEEYRKRYFT